MNYELESKVAFAGLPDVNFRNKIDLPLPSYIQAGDAVFYKPDSKELMKAPGYGAVFLGIAMFSQLDGDNEMTNVLSVLQEGVIWVKVLSSTSIDRDLKISYEGQISSSGRFLFGDALLAFDSDVEEVPNQLHSATTYAMRCIVNVKGGKILEGV